MRDSEIEEACVHFASFCPPTDEQWDAFLTRMDDGAAPKWWAVLRDLVDESDDVRSVRDLAVVLGVLLERYGVEVGELAVAAARADRRLATLIAEAVGTAPSPDWNLVDRLGTDVVVEAWVRHQKTPAAWDGWSLPTVSDEVDFAVPDRAWQMILDTVAASGGDDAVLVMVGVALIEDLLDRDDSDLFLERIERQARRDPWFKTSLRHIWVWNTVSDEVFDRLQLAAGVQLRHDGREQPGDL